MTPEVERVLIQHDLRFPVLHTDYVPEACECRTGGATPFMNDATPRGAWNDAAPASPSGRYADGGPGKWATVRAAKLQDGGVCLACGGLTVRTGTCTTCTQCGETGGCG